MKRSSSAELPGKIVQLPSKMSCLTSKNSIINFFLGHPVECGHIYRISLNLPRKARKSCHTCDILYMYSLVYKLVINASDRGVQDTSVFPDLCLQSKTFLIRLLLHTLSLWLNIAPVQYFFKALSNKVSYFGRQIFSFKRSYFRLVWENST